MARSKGVLVLETGLLAPLGSASPLALSARLALGDWVLERGARARRKLEERGERSRDAVRPTMDGVRARRGRLE